MVVLKRLSRKGLSVLHAKYLEASGMDARPPGARADQRFYGAYFHDLNTNKLNACVPAP